jgi:TRAP-type C4-dicarboxylate transport system substrate-binding protein
MLRTLSVGAAVLFAAGLTTASLPAHAEKLKFQTSSNASHLSLAILNRDWVPKLKERTQGRWEIELLPIKAVVPHRETPQAVAKGILDGDMTAVSYFAGKDAGFALLGDLIAGWDKVDQQNDYCRNGGGKEMLQKLFAKYFPGVTVIACGAYNKEAFVSKVPIRTVDDLKGKKIRSPEGLAADVFRRVGAAPVSLPTSETYGALEKGVIDAADNSAYANNDANGMHKVAKFPIYPGIHSMPMFQFTISTKVWKKMSEQDRKTFETWFNEAYDALAKAIDAEDERLVARDKAGKDITVIDWAQSERDKFRSIAEKAWADVAKKSPLAKEAYESETKYMRAKGLLK